MNRSGFTIVEIIITVTVMGILLAIALVNVSASQVRARDEERKTDVESIAQHLDSFYKNGSGMPGELLGRYPSVDFAADMTTVRQSLINADPKSLAAPGVRYDDGVMSVVPATNAIQTVGAVEPAPTYDEYVYQPLSWAGGAWQLCTGDQECRRFNLFYRLEVDDSVKKVESRNR